ncbi:MAG TPA: hypothetical protein VFB62_28810 [Polyangiaceae bacterium]|nr:hypothetical protein [Polyangiaceae bacterium]
MTSWDSLRVLVIGAVSACGGDRTAVAPDGDATGVRSATPVQTSSPSAAAAPDAAVARPPVCDELLARFEREEKAASHACKAASDCDCYAPPEPPCSPMDAARSASAETLRKIAQEYSEAKCHPLVACAPQPCQRACRAGRCENDR